MSGPTTTYRVYRFDGALNILGADVIEAASDEDAVATAERLEFGMRCEVWDGHRLVAQLQDRRRQA